MNKTEQLEYMVSKVILPKYDFLSFDFIVDYTTGGRKTFNIYFSSEKIPSLDVKSKVLLDVQKLFKMMGFDEYYEKNKKSDRVMTWFKDESMDGYLPAPTTDPRDF